jgi:signal peptidase II
MTEWPSSPPPRPRASRPALVALVLLGCIACDQATKRIAIAGLPEGRRLSLLGDLVRLEHVRNPGAFLGLGGELPAAARTALLTFGVGAAVAAAVVFALRRRTSTREALAAALVAGGGIGNLWDRLAGDGRVTDFMNVGVGGLRTGIFNVADLAIVAGVALLALARRSPGALAKNE